MLLLEAGGRDWHPFVHMPAGLAKIAGLTSINWNYTTTPQPQLGGRVLWCRGKLLGGSSSINAMCYIRGVAGDYDGWAAGGADGWHWDNVLPYFKRAEGNSHGSDAWHGGNGPLSVSDLRHVNPLTRVFIEAGHQAGLTLNDDFNGARQDGVGFVSSDPTRRRTLLSRGGLSQPGQVAPQPEPAHPCHRQPNHLRARPRYRHHLQRQWAGHHFVASREVILSSGAINSPQLLMLSSWPGRCSAQARD